MKPEDVIKQGELLQSAILNDAEELASETAITLLVGIAFNIARLAQALETPA